MQNFAPPLQLATSERPEPPMSAVTLTPRALYQQVAELLRQRIFNRELPPGSWIDELRIAEEFGISRTPLREALKVLAAEGLVTMKVRRGAYVTEVSEQDLREVYELLALLESDAAGVACQRASTTELAELQTLHHELQLAAQPEPIGSRERFFALNEHFHRRLLELAGNRWRQQTVADLRKVMKLNRHSSLLKSGRMQESLKEHETILAALLARDTAAAVQAVKTHFSNGLQAAT